jgi:hypothetical protein
MGRRGGYPAADKLFALARSLAIALALLLADNPRTSHLLDTIAPYIPASHSLRNSARKPFAAAAGIAEPERV